MKPYLWTRLNLQLGILISQTIVKLSSNINYLKVNEMCFIILVSMTRDLQYYNDRQNIQSSSSVDTTAPQESSWPIRWRPHAASGTVGSGSALLRPRRWLPICPAQTAPLAPALPCSDRAVGSRSALFRPRRWLPICPVQTAPLAPDLPCSDRAVGSRSALFRPRRWLPICPVQTAPLAPDLPCSDRAVGFRSALFRPRRWLPICPAQTAPLAPALPRSDRLSETADARATTLSPGRLVHDWELELPQFRHIFRLCDGRKMLEHRKWRDNDSEELNSAFCSLAQGIGELNSLKDAKFIKSCLLATVPKTICPKSMSTNSTRYHRLLRQLQNAGIAMHESLRELLCL